MRVDRKMRITMGTELRENQGTEVGLLGRDWMRGGKQNTVVMNGAQAVKMLSSKLQLEKQRSWCHLGSQG